MSQPTSASVERAANLFDLRRIIGGVLTVWGVLLIIMGLTGSVAEKNKAAGININLVAGIGMLVVGLLFLLWAFSRPLGTELAAAEAAESEEPGRVTRRDRERSGGSGDAGSQ
jgi:hypothetical protein